MFKVLCFLADIELTCLTERICKQCLRKDLFYSMLILFQLTFIDTKGSICLEELLMLLMDRNFNPFAFSNKQAHIINGNIPAAFRYVTFFSQNLTKFSLVFKKLKLCITIHVSRFCGSSQRKIYGLKTNQFHITRCNITSASFDAISWTLSFYHVDHPERGNRSRGKRPCSHSNFPRTLFSTTSTVTVSSTLSSVNFMLI